MVATRRAAHPTEHCDIHHCHPYRCGGPTDIHNGHLLCPAHHHFLHKHGWTLRPAPDGNSPITYRPDGTRFIITRPNRTWLTDNTRPQNPD